MDIPKNTFKRRAQAGETQFGMFHGIPDSYAAEICAGAGFDWIVIDGEHAPFDLRTILHHLQAMSGYNVSPIVRVPEGNPNLIKQLLDAGVQTLIVPMVETAEEAQLLVRSVQYPPKGIRGVGTALSRAARWNRVKGYFDKADDEMCLIVQVESVKGLENLEAIASVDGVDGVLIGPADLGASMGYLGKPGHTEVVEAVCGALQTIRKTGKIAGMLTVSNILIQKYMEAGANMVGVGLDTLILARATQKLAQSYVSKKEDRS